MIRPASADDAGPIAALHVRAWQRAYGDFIAVSDMPTVAEREEVWRRPFPGRAWVWDQDGTVAGVVGIGDGVLSVLYVDPPAQGAGVGSALHDHALAELRGAGCDHAVVWVYAANGQARDFYAARGWTPDGEQDHIRGALAIRLKREL